MKRTYQAKFHNEIYVLRVDRLSATEILVQTADHEWRLDVEKLGKHHYAVLCDNKSYQILYSQKQNIFDADCNGTKFSFELCDERELRRTSHAGFASSADRTVSSPMPGKIIKIEVEEGARVKAGQGIVVVEAMKMENELKAPLDGVVQSILVKEGDSVEGAQPLVVIAKEESV